MGVPLWLRGRDCGGVCDRRSSVTDPLASRRSSTGVLRGSYGVSKGYCHCLSCGFYGRNFGACRRRRVICTCRLRPVVPSAVSLTARRRRVSRSERPGTSEASFALTFSPTNNPLWSDEFGEKTITAMGCVVYRDILPYIMCGTMAQQSVTIQIKPPTAVWCIWALERISLKRVFVLPNDAIGTKQTVHCGVCVCVCI